MNEPSEGLAIVGTGDVESDEDGQIHRPHHSRRVNGHECQIMFARGRFDCIHLLS